MMGRIKLEESVSSIGTRIIHPFGNASFSAPAACTLTPTAHHKQLVCSKCSKATYDL